MKTGCSNFAVSKIYNKLTSSDCIMETIRTDRLQRVDESGGE